MPSPYPISTTFPEDQLRRIDETACLLGCSRHRAILMLVAYALEQCTAGRIEEVRTFLPAFTYGRGAKRPRKPTENGQ